jgi:Cu-Zn family superoxide dismutase
LQFRALSDTMMHRGIAAAAGLAGAATVAYYAASPSRAQVQAAPAPAAKAATAICILGPVPNANDSGVRGVVRFRQSRAGGDVSITGRITGLTRGKHGFHIHATGDHSQGCTTAGGHFNPLGAPHGGPSDPPSKRHIGDLGNIEADAGGVAEFTLRDGLISLLPGDKASIIGRSVVVHADEDDLGRGGYPDSATTGHAGARVSCGVVGISEDVDA